MLCAAAVSAQLPEKSDSSVPADYSKEGAVIQEFAKSVTFAASGSLQVEQTAAIRIQSEAGVRQFGVLTFGYTNDNQKLEIVYVRVRKADGTTVLTPTGDAQDVSSEVTRVAPTYSDLREKQVPVRALGVGDVLEYQVRTIQDKPEVPNQFWFSHRFVKGAVVLSETLRVAFPAGKYVKVVSPEIQPTIQELAGTKIYLWKTSQRKASLPASQEEKAKLSTEGVTPSVQLTTFHNWDEVGRWYGDLQAARIAVTPAIQARAAQLTAGLTTDDDKQQAIYNYVSTNFRYISISLGAGRYQPHTAAEILTNQYGDCKDKHTLFAALLKAAGIEAWPALIGAGIKLDDTVPSPEQFNHVITYLPKSGHPVWLDTTPEVAPYGLLSQILRDKKALVIPVTGPAVLMETPADPPSPNFELVEAKSTLQADGTLSAHFEVTTRGDSELIMRSAFHQVPPAKWQHLVELIIRAVGFAGTVSNVSVTNPENLKEAFHYSYDYRRSDYSDWPNRRIIPPMYPMTLPAVDSEEKFPQGVALGAKGKVIYRATIQLPNGYSAEIPTGQSLHSEFADYHSQYSLQGSMLTVERETDVKQRKVPPTSIDAYGKFVKQQVSDEERFIQLANNSGARNQTATIANNPEAESLIQQAVESMANHNLNAARDELAQAERLNPKQRYLWAAYGNLYLASNEVAKSLDALKKELDNYPDSVPVARTLAQVQMRTGHREQAIETLGKLVKMMPGDADAAGLLATLLIAGKRYPEVPAVLHDALAAAPDNQQLETLQAEALVRSGHKDEGAALVKKFSANATEPDVLNNSAYLLADTKTDLPLARSCAERAVSKLEEASKTTSLNNFSNDDLKRVVSLAAAWDTLGWVYFQSGDLPKAEQYIEASWLLSENGIVADHLGQIYAAQGRQAAATHEWRLALAANSSLVETRERLLKSGSAPEMETISLHGKAKITMALRAEEELGKLRTSAVPDLPKQEASAEFFLLFSDGKVSGAHFISGSPALQSAAGSLEKANYATPFPDHGPEKIVRRGILSCSTYTKPSCQFVLLLPSTTRNE